MIANLWDCVCDACDREGRYHKVGQGRYVAPPPQKPSRWWLLILAILIIGTMLYARWLP